MSSVAAYNFLSKRLELAGWHSIPDTFQFENAASSLFYSKSYLLQFNSSRSTEQGNKSAILEHDFTLILLLSGNSRDLQSVKYAISLGEDLLKQLLNPVGLLEGNILALTLNSYELSPFDDESDDKLIFTASLTVKNVMCLTD